MDYRTLCQRLKDENAAAWIESIDPIIAASNIGQRMISAVRYNDTWAIHPPIGFGWTWINGWTVTHIASGRCCQTFRTFDTALEVAGVLTYTGVDFVGFGEDAKPAHIFDNATKRGVSETLEHYARVAA